MRPFWTAALVALAVGGCASEQPMPIYAPPPMWYAAPPTAPANPLMVPIGDGNYVFDQVADVVDDYFPIEREDRVKQVGDIVTEGRISTYYKTSPGVFEPWEADSVTLYDRVENTFQSIRRKATVRVIPTQGGYLVDVAVEKELEDLAKPQHASTGQATFQHGSTLDRGEDTLSGPPTTKGWIRRGRDPVLEQQMLGELQARLAQVAAQPPPVVREL